MANPCRFRNPPQRGFAAPLARQATTFAGVGIIATSVHYLVLVTSVQVFGARPVPAALLGFTVGALVSYVLNRKHTFDSERPHREAAWRFASVAAVAFLLTFAVMFVLVDRRHMPYLLAQAVTTCVVMAWTFSANRFWTFRALP